RQHDLERRRHQVRAGPPSHVEEVGGPATSLCHHVEGGHDQARTVSDDADFPVELHILKPLLVGSSLRGIHREGGAERGELRMASGFSWASSSMSTPPSAETIARYRCAERSSVMAA